MLDTVGRGITASLCTSQKRDILAPDILGNRVITAADYNIGLNTDTPQLVNAMLGRFGFYFMGTI